MAPQTKKRRLSGTQLTAIKASLAAFSVGITVTGAAILAGADALAAQAAASPVPVVNQTQETPRQTQPQFRATTPSDQSQPQTTPRQRQPSQVSPPTQTPSQATPTQPRPPQVTPTQPQPQVAPTQPQQVTPQQPQQVTPTQPQQRQQVTPAQSSPRPFTRSRSSR
ncbi:MAG: hypothetical protein U0768_19690 [Anaerolineae bacterium]